MRKSDEMGRPAKYIIELMYKETKKKSKPIISEKQDNILK